MIGKNLFKSLAVAAVAVAATSPVMSHASTQYTGKTPASIAMMAATTGVSVKAVSVTTKHKLKHHKPIKKASVTTKHKVLKKHSTVKAKKKATA
jgi:hypothetical protein